MTSRLGHFPWPNNKSLAFAYLLGIYLSDGWVRDDERSFYLTSVDKDIALATYDGLKLLLLGRTVTFKGPLPPKGSGRKSYYKVYGYSPSFVNMLTAATGYKSKVPEALYDAPVEVVRSFIAGLFDGDGCISKQRRWNCRVGYSYQLTIIGNQDYLLDLPDLLNEYGVKSGKLCTRNTDDCLSLTVNIRSFIERGFYFCCKRKQQRLEDYVKSFRKRR